MNEIIYTKKFRKTIRKVKKSRYYLQKDFYHKVLAKIENLKLFPYMYPKIGEKYRKITIQNYIIRYRIENHTIYIVDIIPTKSSRSNQFY